MPATAHISRNSYPVHKLYIDNQHFHLNLHLRLPEMLTNAVNYETLELLYITNVSHKLCKQSGDEKKCMNKKMDI